MLKHPASTAFGVLAACTILYLISSSWHAASLTNSRAIMETPGAQSASVSDLTIQFTAIPHSKPARFAVKISNRNPDHAITFLRWDSPLDPLALDLGVVTLKDAATGEAVPGPGLMVRRKMPPPREDLVEVPSRGDVSDELTLDKSWIPENLQRVQVHAEGQWVAAWALGKDKVGDGELEAMGGERALEGAFQSEDNAEVEL